MSATELAVVINYVVSLQQKFDVLQHHQQTEQQQLQQLVQQLQGRVETLESKSTHTKQALWSLQTNQADLQTGYTELRSDHDALDYEVRFELYQALEDRDNLKALVVADSDYYDQLSLEDYWSKRHPEAFE